MLALGAIAEAGVHPGDRIEHAAVAPPEAIELAADLGVTVVLQPGFVHERGDSYLSEVEPRDRPWLLRGRAWLEAGVPIAAGSDAPYGAPDPWRAMAAAVDRRTRDGAVLGPDQALTPEEALALFSGSLEDPGGRPRRGRGRATGRSMLALAALEGGPTSTDARSCRCHPLRREAIR